MEFHNSEKNQIVQIDRDISPATGKPIKGKLRFEQIDVHSPLYPDSLVLRDEVLRKPLGLKWTDAEREEEARCIHLVALAGANVVATLLLKPMEPGTVKMRQVAVHPAMQRVGIGSKLVAFAEETAKALGYRRICAHVRLSAVSFYRKAGYSIIGDPFVEVTIPHVLAEKLL
ncbi:MAG TPA: GNAT family N-acetyltransferase [Chthoniobacteraceae bacterium]|nr:GNAT family N-acetyltransferase [Chthoniobacteraceae bacterium]